MSDSIEVHLENREDFNHLFLLMANCQNGSKIRINNHMNHLEPIDILMLTQFSIIQNKRNCDIVIASSKEINLYLKDIGLIDFIESNTHVPTTINGIASFTAMPIRRVEQETMNEYISATESYFHSICINKDLTMLNLCMSELINNVHDHSKSEIGAYVFSQYYPEENEIKIAVSDYGIGIVNSVNNYLKTKNKTPLSEKECLKWALEEFNTTQSIPQNAGRGLSNIESFVKANKSNWQFLSDKVILNGDAKNRYTSNSITNFKGTIVQLTIKIGNLEASGFVENFDWNM